MALDSEQVLDHYKILAVLFGLITSVSVGIQFLFVKSLSKHQVDGQRVGFYYVFIGGVIAFPFMVITITVDPQLYRIPLLHWFYCLMTGVFVSVG